MPSCQQSLSCRHSRTQRPPKGWVVRPSTAVKDASLYTNLPAHFASDVYLLAPSRQCPCEHTPRLLCRPAHAAYFATDELAKSRLETADRQDQSPHVFVPAAMAAAFASNAMPPSTLVSECCQAAETATQGPPWCQPRADRRKVIFLAETAFSPTAGRLSRSSSPP